MSLSDIPSGYISGGTAGVDWVSNYNSYLLIRDYFSDVYQSNSYNDYSYLSNHKPYVPYAYLSEVSSLYFCGFRDNYLCLTNTMAYGSVYGYKIYVYDTINDRLIYKGFYRKNNPDNTDETYNFTYGVKCNNSKTLFRCGTSYLDDFMYSNKSSEIFITCLYFFIPLLLFIIGLKVLKKGLFK